MIIGICSFVHAFIHSFINIYKMALHARYNLDAKDIKVNDTLSLPSGLTV